MWFNLAASGASDASDRENVRFVDAPARGSPSLGCRSASARSVSGSDCKLRWARRCVRRRCQDRIVSRANRAEGGSMQARLPGRRAGPYGRTLSGIDDDKGRFASEWRGRAERLLTDQRRPWWRRFNGLADEFNMRGSPSKELSLKPQSGRGRRSKRGSARVSALRALPLSLRASSLSPP